MEIITDAGSIPAASIKMKYIILQVNGPLRRRLMEYGFLAGNEISLLGEDRGSIMCRIRGAKFAIKKEDFYEWIKCTIK